jgi:hypothetical protein
MKAWSRPVVWAAAALAAGWLRGLVEDERLHFGLTIIALASAVAAAIYVLELVGGRPPSHE